MKKHRLDFKETQVFEWDSEPKSERPSELHTTGFSSASGYYHPIGERGQRAPIRKSPRKGAAVFFLGLVAAISIGTAGVLWLAQMLRS